MYFVLLGLPAHVNSSLAVKVRYFLFIYTKNTLSKKYILRTNEEHKNYWSYIYILVSPSGTTLWWF